MNRICHILGPIGFVWILFAFPSPIHAQLEVNAGISASDLASAIAGPGVIIQNPQINGASVSYGSYSTANTSLPFSDGVLLSTGKASNAIGPNNIQHKSYINSFSGSELLDTSMNQITNDACTFEFDIIPQGDTIRFNFTFASEEYHNFVGSIYSDVFGFFISGPGINGIENIALVPNTNQAVSINTINLVANNTYFFDNDNPEGDDLQYNGYTLGLEAKKGITACETYHLTLVIADANDYSIDSGVFIEKIESPNASLSSTTAGNIDYMVEGCNDGTITFTRLSSDLSEDITLTYYVSGTAINGVDYLPQIGSDPDPAVPKTIDIPSGESSVSITVSPVDDDIPNVDKFLAIYLASTNCPDILYDSLFFPIFDSLIVSTSPDTAICYGQSLLLQTLEGGSTWSWSPSASLSDPLAQNTMAQPDSSTTYTLYTTASFCEAWDSVLVSLSDLNVIVDSVKLACSGANNGYIEISISNGIGPYSISWTGPNGFTSSDSVLSGLEPGSYTYTISDAVPCSISETIVLLENEPIIVSLDAVEISPFDYNITCNGDSSGTIYASISGGSPDYQYLWSTGTQNTTVLTNQPAGNYTLLVIDSYNCFSLDSIALNQPPPLQIQLDSLVDVSCNGENSGYIEVSASGGAGSFSYSWNSNPPTNSSVLQNVDAGTYTITINDGYQCTVSDSYTIVEPSFALSATLDSIIDIQCPGDSDGQIFITADGGTPPYTYYWNSIPIQTTQNASNLSSGIYQLQIRDSLGCVFTESYEVSLLVDPLAAYISGKSDILCSGDSTGSAAITVSGGSGPFNYLWTPGGYTSSSMTGLTAGNYSVSIDDTGLCSQSTTVDFSIDQPSDSIEISLSTSSINGFNLSCFESNDGNINSSISGGTPPYNYSWTGPDGFTSINQNISSLQAGLYSLSLVDQNGCSSLDTITLTQPEEISISFVMTPATCPTPGSNDGTITLTVNGGVPAYTFDWTGPNGFTSNNQDLINLEAGVYNLTIEDAINCTETFSITVTQPDNFTIDPIFSAYTGGWNISCFSYNDGTIDVDVSDVALPIQYSWNLDGMEISTDTALSDVGAGVYELIITDANNCIENRFFTLSQPDSIIIDFDAFEDAFGNSISCFGGDDGELTAGISGGTPSYTWLWTYPDNSTSSDELIQNLSVGIYSLNISDVNSCIGIDSILVAQPDSLSISLMSPDSNGYNVTCFNGNDGSIITTVNGGTPPFLFQWVYPDGGIGSTDQNPGYLQAGTYILLLTDAYLCTATDTITLVSSDAITFTTDISDYNGFSVPCTGDSLADVEIIPNGGTPPYFVVWDNGDTSFTQSGLSAGQYEGLIYDSQSCIGQFSVEITEPPSLLVDFTISEYSTGFQLQCKGDSSGYIYTNISGGIPPYLINWTGPDSFSSAQDSIINLVAGDYNLLISDQNSCVYSEIISLSEPDSIDLTIDQISISTCAADSASSLIANTSGGVGDFSYLWSGPNGFSSTNQIITNLDEGIYCVEVMDQNACSKSACYEIIDPLPISIVLSSPIFNAVNILCHGDSSGSITSLVSGGIPPYTYAWTGPIGTNPVGSNPSNLIAGTYSLLITDSLGCTALESIVLTESSPFVNTIISSDYNGYSISCFASDDGEIVISTSNGSPPYSYVWSNEMGPIAGNDSLQGLSTGVYYVEVSDANACTLLDSIILNEPDSLAIALISPEYYPGINISCKDGANGTIQSVVAGGVSAYNYSWSGPNSFISTDSALSQLSAGWYLLNLIDLNGCAIQDSIELIEPDSTLTVDYSIDIKNSGTNISCFDGNDGSISIHISGGIADYQVYWLGPNGFSSNDTLIENLVAGNYFLSIVDSASCTFSDEIILTQPNDSLSAINTLNNNICFGDSSASILVEAMGASPPFTIYWEGPNNYVDSTFLISNLSNGSYSYLLSDTNACFIQDTLSITSSEEIVANEVQQNINCFGDSNGSIALNPSGGGSSYTFSWTGPNGFISDLQSISDLDSGQYCVSIESNLFCVADFCFFISEPDSLYNLDSLINPTCGYANGAIYLEVVGGTTPYTVDWGIQSGESLVDISAGTYSALISDSLNCMYTAAYELIGPDSIAVIDSLTNNSCYESMDGSIMVSITGGTPGYEILWSGPEGFNSSATSIENLANGNYQLSVIDSFGCAFIINFEIMMPDSIEAILYSPTYDNGFNVSAYGNDDGTIETSNVNGGTPDYQYFWTGPDAFTSNNASINSLIAGNYVLLITDLNDCIYLDSLFLTQPESLVLPSGFTPNNDGYNDNYVVPGINDGNPASIKIYNRWGNIVFESANYQNNWDGTGKTGANLPDGTYFVIVEFEKNAKSLNGYIDLRR